MQRPRVGTAGWAIPAGVSHRFGSVGAALERYGGQLNAAEINSTFSKAHRPQTFARWAALVGPDFRFAAKVSRAITHDQRLCGDTGQIDDFLAGLEGLGSKLEVLLVQLPPSLAFEPGTAANAFAALARSGVHLACEPRHATWFTPDADAWLAQSRIARVAADPPRHPADGAPGGWRGLSYYRLHGSPRTYWSSYEPAFIADLALRLERDPAPLKWCVFDNTASGAAAANALALLEAQGKV